MELKVEKFEYRKESKKKVMFLALGITICFISFITDILVGPAMLSLKDVILSLVHSPDVAQNTNVIIWTLRLPTALMALIVGASLGIAGAGMQTILDNPLASPYTLGISAGAGFGASLAIVTGLGTLKFLGDFMVPVSAFVFSSIASLLIYLISKSKKFTSETMVLAGIGLLFLFQALQSLMQYVASPEALQNIVFWTLGSLTKANWSNIPVVFVVFIIIFPIMIKESWKLTALKLGDEKAAGLGVNVERLRFKSFITISIITSVAVSFVGTIGFIGIVGPHISRILVGEDQRFFLPMSAICGAGILSLASIGSKIIKSGAIFPIGIVTAIIGVPFFFSLILTKKRGYF